jgi:hypothetical protein
MTRRRFFRLRHSLVAGEETELAPDLIRGGGWNDLNYLNDLNARNLDWFCRARAAFEK